MLEKEIKTKCKIINTSAQATKRIKMTLKCTRKKLLIKNITLKILNEN